MGCCFEDRYRGGVSTGCISSGLPKAWHHEPSSDAICPPPTPTSLINTRAIGAEVSSLPGTASIGWVRVSAKPLKQALATWASKWVYLFTKYLQDKVGGGVGLGVGD
jgi:hypothetical protein